MEKSPKKLKILKNIQGHYPPEGRANMGEGGGQGGQMGPGEGALPKEGQVCTMQASLKFNPALTIFNAHPLYSYQQAAL